MIEYITPDEAEERLWSWMKSIPPGTDSFTPIQQAVLLAYEFDSEVCNGGFDQFLSHSIGSKWQQTLEALKTIGAHRVAKILEKAVGLFPAGSPSSDHMTRVEQLRNLPPESHSILSDLDGEYYDLPRQWPGECTISRMAASLLIEQGIGVRHHHRLEVKYLTDEAVEVEFSRLGTFHADAFYVDIYGLKVEEVLQDGPAVVGLLKVSGWSRWRWFADGTRADVCVMLAGKDVSGGVLWTCSLKSGVNERTPEGNVPQQMFASLIVPLGLLGKTHRVWIRIPGVDFPTE
jgi:hypothetical protein